LYAKTVYTQTTKQTRVVDLSNEPRTKAVLISDKRDTHTYAHYYGITALDIGERIQMRALTLNLIYLYTLLTSTLETSCAL